MTDPNQRIALQVRMPEGLRAKLSEAAKQGGRPLNREVVHRLMRSLGWEPEPWVQHPPSMQTIGLLPCPFCGGAAIGPADTSYGYWRVCCPDENECPVQPITDGKTQIEALENWNTRQVHRKGCELSRVDLLVASCACGTPKP